MPGYRITGNRARAAAGLILIAGVLCACQQNPLVKRIIDVTDTASTGGYVPVIESLSPATPVLDSTLTVTGKNFGVAKGDSTLVWGTSDISTVISWSSTTIKFTVPGTRPGLALKVTTPFGSGSTVVKKLAKAYTVTYVNSAVHTGLSIKTGDTVSVTGSGTMTTSNGTSGIEGLNSISCIPSWGKQVGVPGFNIQSLAFGFSTEAPKAAPASLVSQVTDELLLGANWGGGTNISGQYDAVVTWSVE